MTLRVMAMTLFLCSAAIPADTWPVAGTVINAPSGSPMSSAQVALYRTPGNTLVSALRTDAAGKFRFEVPAGTYLLRAGLRDAMSSYGARPPDVTLASSVIVGPGKDTGSLIFRYFPPSTISGRVLDEFGEPVESALVQLARHSVTNGQLVTKSVFSFRTDDTGHYRFGRITSGQYFLTVTGKPWYAGSPLASTPAVASPAFWPAYYPNVSDASRAQPLLVKPGEERTADFVLRAANGATVTVKYSGASSDFRGRISLKYTGVAGNDAFQRTVNVFRNQGEERLEGIPPGRYTVEAAGPVGSDILGASQEIDVSGTAVTLDLKLRPWPRVTGRVLPQNPGTPLDAGLFALLIFDDIRQLRTPVSKDGQFQFEPVPAGRYKVSLSNSRSAYLVGFGASGTTMRDGDIIVAAGETPVINLIAGHDVGSVGGFVMDGTRPVEGVLAVLIPEDPAALRQRHYAFQTESDGSFEWDYVPAGRYLLFAVDDTTLESQNPQIVAPYRNKAKLVVVEPNSKITERLALTAPTK